MIIIIITLLVIIGVLVWYLFKIGRLYDQTKADSDAIKAKYEKVIDVDEYVASKQLELNVIQASLEKAGEDHKSEVEKLNSDFIEKRKIYESLLKEISILEENLEDISYGLYKPHYDYKTSEEFKLRLDAIRDREKQIIKSEQATHCSVQWTVGGSESQGKKMTKEYSKIMLRAFNGECDGSIARVNWNNIGNMEARIEKSFEAINKLGAIHQISIQKDYLNLKLQELRHEFELELKLYHEKEEQRKIREQMREEEKATREIEKARQEAEEQENLYQKALDKAKVEIESATGHEIEKLNEKIRLLEENLKNAKEVNERAISRAHLTKSGHVYFISNIGSFGEEIFKVGMTRRLNPQDRIDELGDASVPFDFDVHGLIYSEDAPNLERTLHRKLDERRLNLVNQRTEFYRSSLDEIEALVKELGLKIELAKIPEAREFRSSLSLREAKKAQASAQSIPNKNSIQGKLDKFPDSLE